MSIAGISKFSPENLKNPQALKLSKSNPMPLTYDPYGATPRGLPKEVLETLLTEGYASAKIDEINLLPPNKFWLGQKVTLSPTKTFLGNWEIADPDLTNCTGTEVAILTGFTEPIIGTIEKVRINSSYLQELFTTEPLNSPTGVLLDEALKAEAETLEEAQKNIHRSLARARHTHKVPSLCYYEYFVRFPSNTRLGRIKYFLAEAFLTQDLTTQIAEVLVAKPAIKQLPSKTTTYVELTSAISTGVAAAPEYEIDPKHLDWATVTPEMMSSPAFKRMLQRMQSDAHK